MWPRKLLLLSFAAVSSATPAQPFETEPSFEPESFNIAHFDNQRSLLAPGYIFVSPLISKTAWGPQIYDVDGNLIFYAGNRRVQDFKACDFQGERGNHLCWHQSRFKPGSDARIDPNHLAKRANNAIPARPVGKKLVFDSTYSQVGKSYSSGFGQGATKDWPNGHEYNMLAGGESFIQAVYKPKRMDLSPYTGKRDGYINDGCFQERSVRSGETIFEWCYSDHLPLWETHLFFSTKTQTNETSGKAGEGTIRHPWDFIHLNAVDKTIEGDYLVSGRHLDQIIKIAGLQNAHGLEPGSIVWRLGGKSNEFEMLGNFTFSRQHDVRLISTTMDETIFSIFDNAWEGTNEPSAKVSSGKIIGINNNTMQARLLREYKHPDRLLARAMGSMQVLPNKNAFVGWGASPQLTEFSEDGAVLWHAWYDRPFRDKSSDAKPNRRKRPDDIRLASSPDQEWSYRSFKFPWVGKPFWGPKLIVYRRDCSRRANSPLLAYVSWNGATEVHRWRFYGSPDVNGPWTAFTTVDRQGFETKVNITAPVSELEGRDQFIPWIKAEALGNDEVVLGNVTRQIFVPTLSVRHRCNRDGCRFGNPDFHYPPELNCSWLCAPGWGNLLSMIMVLVPLILLAEVTVALGELFCRALAQVDRRAGNGGIWNQVLRHMLGGRLETNKLLRLPLADQDTRFGLRNGHRLQNYSDAPNGYAKKE